MTETEVRFLCGELSLGGMMSVPEGGGPFPAVVVCHPHPLYGGSMDNNVVDSLCEALSSASHIAFKFNFRGVGASQGEYNQGIGEQEDVRAAISSITGMAKVDSERIGLAGYSAGAGFSFPVGVEDARVKALVAVSPPLAMFDFDSLKSCHKPKLLVSGSRDTFTQTDQFLGFCQRLPDPRECAIIDGADHFWRGYESALASRVAAFFTEALQ